MRLFILSIILMTISAAAYCAEPKAEIFGQGGVYNETGQGGVTAALIGGGAGAALSERVGLFGEFNYIPVSMRVPSGAFDATGHGLQAGGGLRVYLRPRGNTVRPFVYVGGGFMRAALTARTSSWWGPSVAVSVSVNGGYIGTGLGAEIGRTRFGARPEFRYLREVVAGGEGGNALIAMCGVYYRF